MFRIRLLAGLLLCGAAVFAVAGVACDRGDVGRPCNHGVVDPPSTKLVTFPALSCTDLLCVFAEDPDLPKEACTSDSQCNETSEGNECVRKEDEDTGTCKVKIETMLRKSMCSARCLDDTDCRNTSIFHRPVEKDNNCRTGFMCTVIQQLGEFCCEKLCVCRDDLGDMSDLITACGATDDDVCASR